MQKSVFGLVAFCLVVGGNLSLEVIGTAHAQDRAVYDRLDRLERDLNQVQRQVYRNEISPGSAPTAPAGASGGDNLDTQIRMDKLEEQMRTLTGQLEEIQYNISQLKAQAEQRQTDNEQRLQALEHPENGGGAKGAATAARTAASNKGPIDKSTGDKGAGDMDEAPSTGGTLTAPGQPQKGAAAPAQAAAAPAAAGSLPNGSTQDQYNYAFGLVRAQDYAAAEGALKAFIQKHPNDELAGNAQYWLGQTYFVRNDYQNAAAAFAQGYQNYPKSSKAPDILLKLGISLGNTNRKQDACFAFAKLERDFPKMPQATKDQEVREKHRLGC